MQPCRTRNPHGSNPSRFNRHHRPCDAAHQFAWRHSGAMSDAIDRALSENHSLIAAILDHHSSGRHVPAVALLERLQLNLEFIAALSEHGLPNPSPAPPSIPDPPSAHVSSAPPRIAPALPVPLVTQPVGTMYWTPEEHARFQQGMRLYGNARDGKPNFKAIASFVGTRTPVQVRSHLQKVQKKARKDAEHHDNHPQYDQTEDHTVQQPDVVANQAASPPANLPTGNPPTTNVPTANLSPGNTPTGNIPADNQAQGAS